MNENQGNGKGRGLKPFVKGNPRINRHGRPQGFDQARKLALQISHEEVTLSNGEKMSVAEALPRSWAKSNEPTLQRAFIEIAYGKVPDKVETTGLENKPVLILHYAHERPDLDDGDGPRRPLLPDAD